MKPKVAAPVCDRLLDWRMTKAGRKPALRFMDRLTSLNNSVGNTR